MAGASASRSVPAAASARWRGSARRPGSRTPPERFQLRIRLPFPNSPRYPVLTDAQPNNPGASRTIGTMHILDIFQAHPTTFSFEFFPPKTDKASDELFRNIAQLQVLQPSFV